jgi:hypothetical protein
MATQLTPHHPLHGQVKCSYFALRLVVLAPAVVFGAVFRSPRRYVRVRRFQVYAKTPGHGRYPSDLQKLVKWKSF